MNIELLDVTKTYRRNLEKITVLNGASVRIDSGSSTAIIGPSGSGKTTLLSLVAGLDDPDSGVVRIGDTEMNRLNEDARTALRCANVGIVFQKFHLIPTLTAVENVALPLEINGVTDVQDRAIAALESVGLAQRAEHLPNELSGGECQRVAIARSLIFRPKLLLADEPSGNLDAVTGDMIMDLLFSLCSAQKTTVVLVTHNLKHAERCRRILTLRDGKLVDA